MPELKLRLFGKKSATPWGLENKFSLQGDVSHTESLGWGYSLQADGAYTRPPSIRAGKVIAGGETRASVRLDQDRGVALRLVSSEDFTIGDTRLSDMVGGLKIKPLSTRDGKTVVETPFTGLATFDFPVEYKPSRDQAQLHIHGKLVSSLSPESARQGRFVELTGEVDGTLHSYPFKVPFRIRAEGVVGPSGVIYAGELEATYKLFNIPLGAISGTFEGRGKKILRYSWGNKRWWVPQAWQLPAPDIGKDLPGPRAKLHEIASYLQPTITPDPEDQGPTRTFPLKDGTKEFIGVGWRFGYKDEYKSMEVSLGFGAGLNDQNQPEIGRNGIVLSASFERFSDLFRW